MNQITREVLFLLPVRHSTSYRDGTGTELLLEEADLQGD